MYFVLHLTLCLFFLTLFRWKPDVFGIGFLMARKEEVICDSVTFGCNIYGNRNRPKLYKICLKCIPLAWCRQTQYLFKLNLNLKKTEYVYGSYLIMLFPICFSLSKACGCILFFKFNTKLSRRFWLICFISTI